jgi:hypothetical protein
MKKYFEIWKFKHPKPSDFKKIMEKESGMELDWYFEQFTETTNTIDYSIVGVESSGGKSTILIQKNGRIPMPLDICLVTKDSNAYWYNIPLRIMRGSKKKDMIGDAFKTITDWPWVYNYYEFEVDFSIEEIKKIQIDPSTRLADIDLENNVWTINNNVGLTIPEIIFKSKL